MKKLTAILLSALLVLSLAACGNSNQNTAKDTQAESGTQALAAKPSGRSAESTGGNDD